ncbi:MAG TPA: FkbM family methyltransferase [Opitutaceae bacterium]|nr:FkbM family methyltransferase [Opitutaceae bacterium]
MKPSSVLAALNRLPLWRRRIAVWDFRLRAPTLDRALYLWLHRIGRMGRADRAYLAGAVRPGMHVADVGANIGLYTLHLARLVGPAGRVYAFEPDPLMLGALRENLAANGAAQAEVFPCAAGGGSGQALLQRNALNSGDNRLGADTGTGWHADRDTVPVRALDEALRGRRVDFIKMDVQGWEGEALRGVGGLLEANPGLQVFFEFWPHGLERAGTTVAALDELLRALRLRPTRPGHAEPCRLAALAAELPAGGYTNVVASREVGRAR